LRGEKSRQKEFLLKNITIENVLESLKNGGCEIEK
jgi:uncharacterized protein YggU (UPF0235/DUF167 family)